MGESRRASRAKDIAALFGLLVLNVALVYPLFTGEYTHHMGSIETSFISHARFIASRYPHLSWNPLWFAGFPFHRFYAPLLPTLNAITAFLVPSLSIPREYRILTAIFYACGPVSFFFLVRYLTKSTLAALLGALCYTVSSSTIYLVAEVRGVASPYHLAPWRLIILTLYGEGPHTAALSIMPLAALGLLTVLKKPSFPACLSTAIAIALVALFSTSATYGLGIILSAVLLSELLLGDPIRKLKTALLCGLMAYGLVAFWYNLSFIQATLSISRYVERSDAVNPAFLLIVAAIAAWLSLRFFVYRPHRQPLFLALALFLILVTIPGAAYLRRLNLAPFIPYHYAHRFIPELDMATALLLALIFQSGWTRLRRDVNSRSVAGFLLAAAPMAAMILFPLPFIRSGWALTSPHPDIEESTEYRVAHWLASRVGEERVYATGTHAFWLNVFTDVPQLRGGQDFSSTNPWWDQVTYQINTGSDGELALLWCQALNIGYIVVNQPSSVVEFKDYWHPEKFEGLLEEVYQEGGDAILQVPLSHPELVQAVSASRLEALHPIEGVLDVNALRAYVHLLEDPPASARVHYTVENNDRLLIQANLQEDTALLVKMTYDSGWRAYLNGASIPIRPDPVDFMIIEPGPSGEYTIELQHGSTWKQWLGYALTALTILSIVAYVAKTKRIVPQPPAELNATRDDRT